MAAPRRRATPTRSATSRRLPRRLSPRLGLIALLAVAALAVLNRLGVFGPRGDDYTRYHNRTFTVARVIDGDTLDLSARDGDKATTRVRLWGVDTPETVDPRRPGPDFFGPEASAFTKRLAADKPVRVELIQNETRDKNGRLLAYIYLPDETMLNEQIILSGHGYADWRFSHPRMERFKRQEAKANKAGAGLWQNVRPEQWPAWRRRMMHPDVPGDTSSAFPFGSRLSA